MRHLQLPLFLFLLITGCAPVCKPVPLPATTARHVVLVHGFLETGSNYKMFKRRLEQQGFVCLVPKLRPSDGRGGLEGLAQRLKQDIDAAFGPQQPIAIVSFSMGGLVSRYYLQNLGGASRCQQLITISSPHHGTLAAWYYPTKGTAEMRPGSQFLADLEKSQSRLGHMPVTSYRTPMDLVIVPPESSQWDRAENLEFPVLLHSMMLNSKAVLSDVERRLRQDAPRATPPTSGGFSRS